MLDAITQQRLWPEHGRRDPALLDRQIAQVEAGEPSPCRDAGLRLLREARCDRVRRLRQLVGEEGRLAGRTT